MYTLQRFKNIYKYHQVDLFSPSWRALSKAALMKEFGSDVAFAAIRN